ncbi:hypothetical protein CDT92_21025 [Cronobacter sakazakii]|nr:hypothetical protein CDT92_21025 [Cronobacter sakazakii]
MAHWRDGDAGGRGGRGAGAGFFILGRGGRLAYPPHKNISLPQAFCRAGKRSAPPRETALRACRGGKRNAPPREPALRTLRGGEASGIEQVNIAVSQMDETAQQNAALVQQSSAATRSLEEQAQQLVEAMASFRLQTAG